MFKRLFDPDISAWQIGERKLRFISYILNQFFRIGLLEVVAYFALLTAKYKLKIDFINTAEYITLIQTVNYFYLGAGGILSGIYTYGNKEEWKARGNYNANDNMNANYVTPNNTSNINITIPKAPTPNTKPDPNAPPSTDNTSVFNPPKGDV
jgi:hypothetical protein